MVANEALRSSMVEGEAEVSVVIERPDQGLSYFDLQPSALAEFVPSVTTLL